MVNKIQDGISKALKAAFPQWDVYGDERVRQGLSTPSFFVRLGECATKPQPGGITQLEQHVEVAYIPPDGDDLGAMWQVGPKVLPLLETLALPDGSFVRGTSLNCYTNDGLLYIHALYRVRMQETQNAPKMGEMHLRNS